MYLVGELLIPHELIGISDESEAALLSHKSVELNICAYTVLSFYLMLDVCVHSTVILCFCAGYIHLTVTLHLCAG